MLVAVHFVRNETLSFTSHSRILTISRDLVELFHVKVLLRVTTKICHLLSNSKKTRTNPGTDKTNYWRLSLVGTGDYSGSRHSLGV